ncbi:MAG: L-seryl-tRNA(Sec) selenium transferase [Litorilinea sp.]
MQAEFRKLPAVDSLLHNARVRALCTEHGQTAIVQVTRTLLAEQRAAIAQGAKAPAPEDWPDLIARAAARRAQPSLLPVINGTGIIIHTNLGRAPLSAAARRAVDAVAAGYSNLEYDLDAGARGSRHDHARQRLRRVTGAEDALIVNNNAAALFLVLAGLCVGKEVMISRGQLVEIGGGFRIPDVLRQSGAQLVEVGTTNRTHAADFRAAHTAQTAAILRVHSSNFKQIGFVTEPPLRELAAAAHAPLPRLQTADDLGPSDAPAILIDDLGSGTLLDTAAFGLAPEPMVQASLAAGADVVTFSGDKLLGGPQAGIVVGRGDLIAQLRRHPLARALRVDKMTLAALDATLAAYEQGRAVDEIPVWQMIGASLAQLCARVEKWRAVLQDAVAGWQWEIWDTQSAVGGGSLPGETLPSVGLAMRPAVGAPNPDAFAAALRAATPPLVTRIHNNFVLVDARTVLPEQDAALVAVLCQVGQELAGAGGAA